MRPIANLTLAAMLAAALAAPAFAEAPQGKADSGATVTAPLQPLPEQPAPNGPLGPRFTTARQYAAVTEMARHLQAIEGAVHPGEDSLGAGNSIVH